MWKSFCNIYLIKHLYCTLDTHIYHSFLCERSSFSKLSTPDCQWAEHSTVLKSNMVEKHSISKSGHWTDRGNKCHTSVSYKSDKDWIPELTIFNPDQILQLLNHSHSVEKQSSSTANPKMGNCFPKPTSPDDALECIPGLWAKSTDQVGENDIKVNSTQNWFFNCNWEEEYTNGKKTWVVW